MDTLGIDIGQVKALANEALGFRALVAWLEGFTSQPAEVAVVLEASGVYGEACAHQLVARGGSVSVVNPAQLSFFARSPLRRGKSDALDAEIIARFGAVMRPRPWQPPDAELGALKLMMRQREARVAMLTEGKNRRHAHRARNKTPAPLLAFTQAHLRFLEGQLAELEARIEAELATSVYRAEVAAMRSVPGIGFVTSMPLLTETAAFGAMHHPKQLAADAGLSPAPHQSGRLSRPSHLAKLGNPRVRRAAYLAAVSASKSASPLRDFYLRLREAGKPAKLALVAVARKLLTIVFALVKSAQPFDPTHPAQPSQAS